MDRGELGVGESRTSLMFVIRDLGVGGAQRQLVQLARGLAARGHRVAVLVFYGGGELETELHGSGVRLYSGQKRGRWDVFGFLSRVFEVVRAEPPDVLHGYLVMGNLVALGCLMVAPKCRVLWGVRASDMERGTHRLEKIAFHLSRPLSRLVEKIIANSVAGAQHLLDLGFPSDRIDVIPNGVDTERFHRSAAAAGSLRQQWGVRPGDHLVGVVARLHPMKGHETFLAALGRLSRDWPELTALFLGDGPADFRRRLEIKARELGVADMILWMHSTEDLAAAYSAFDVTCVSSVYGEGLPNAALESLSCETPCVVTDVGDSASLCAGFPERVVNPGDPEALARALDSILRGPAQVEGHLRGFVQRRFPLTAMIETTEAIMVQPGPASGGYAP